MEYIVLILIGIIGGLFAGTFGLGGGIIYIPAILFILEREGVENFYQVAVATSLIGIIFTGFASAYSHYRKQNVELPILKRIVPAVVVASFLATFIILKLPAIFLKDFYAVFVVLIGIKMFFALLEPKESESAGFREERKQSLPVAGAFTGFISVLLGIGGGSISVPLLSQYYGVDLKKAIGTSAIIGVFIAFFGTAGFFINIAGFHNQHQDIWGFFYIPAVIMIIASVLTAPFGATICQKLNKTLLKKLFGITLFLVGVKILFL